MSGTSKIIQELPTVKGLDLQRYMGRWYEIASMPSRFQPSDTTNTRATYDLLPDGEVSVLNETFKAGGKAASISGKAWKNDKSTDEAKYTVQFWVPPFLPVVPVRGDYWVLDIAADYSHALVGQPKREYMWVLSRTETMEDNVYNSILEKASSLGYDVSKIIKTKHLPGVGTEDSKEKDPWWWLTSMFGADREKN